MMRKPRPVRNWKKAFRMFSIQAMVLAGAIQGAWAALPAEMQSTVSDDWLRAATVVLMVLGIAGRLVVQDAISGGGDA